MQNFYSFIKSNIFDNLRITVEQSHNTRGEVSSYEESPIANGIRCTYNHGEYKSLTLDVTGNDEALLLNVAINVQTEFRTSYQLAPENAINLPFADISNARIMAIYLRGSYWTFPEFTDNIKGIPSKTSLLLINKDGVHYCLLALCGNDFRCEFDGNGAHAISDTCGLAKASGNLLAIAKADCAENAIDKVFRFAREQGAIQVPLADERVMPEMFEHLGWCTWDAFARGVSAEKIFTKLDELKEKNIPIHWVLIDDGWSTSTDVMLADFAADKEKFPNGLKGCIDRIKNEYGIKYVGVWHTFNGYWDGIDPNSPLYESQKENLVTTPAGFVVPALDEDKAFRFWDAWHSYLKEQGVDFVKVDNQSGWHGMITGMMPSSRACRIAHKAIERSVCKHFGGAMINCMGMNTENIFARPTTAVSRNSDDFFVGSPGAIHKQLRENIYNGLWHRKMYICDYDMWWSKHSAAVMNGVTRAISGGPVYFSDGIGVTIPAFILPTVEDDGTIMRCDAALQPTSDCIYTEPLTSGKSLNVWNKSGDCFALAALNFNPAECVAKVNFGGIPELGDKEYVAYEFFTKEYKRIDKNTTLTFLMDYDSTRVWSIYPIQNEDGEEVIYMGSTQKYAPIASKNKTRVLVSDIL